MNLNKITTYVGFAIRSKSICYGVDNIVKAKCYLVCYSELSDRSIRQLELYCNKEVQRLVKLDKQAMENIVLSNKIMAFGITNENLSKAILENL